MCKCVIWKERVIKLCVNFCRSIIGYGAKSFGAMLQTVLLNGRQKCKMSSSISVTSQRQCCPLHKYHGT